MIISSPIDNCFRPPDAGIPNDSVRTVLYLLRRDLVDLYGSESTSPSPNHKAPMLAVLGMMAGLDLMTKLVTGKLHSSGKDFVSFVHSFGSLSLPKAQVLYQYRCALAHSYGLYSKEQFKKKGNRSKIFKFGLDDSVSKSRLMIKTGRNRYQMNFWEMKRFFLKCITSLEITLRAGQHPHYSQLLNNFMRIMEKIGSVSINPSA